MSESTVNVITLDGAVFKLATGDTLVITSPHPLTVEQHEKITNRVKASIPDGVRVMVIGGGLTVSAITKA